MTAKNATLPKAPVVTIMGHVDHGKTTLLDYLRKSHVAAKEAGGITQHIGAYQIEVNGAPITFIDTPGHAAFSQMRAHGASITDIVVLVIAADDGVKPQTKEAIKLIKQGNIPVVVAINKVDVKGASPDMVKAQLVENEILVEGYGGSVPVVEIVAREGKNVDQLLETLQVMAELEELQADPQAPLEAVVVETALTNNMGPTATVLVNQGTLRVGDDLVSITGNKQVEAKVKRLLSDRNVSLTQALPGQPVELLGFKAVPEVGQVLTTLVHQKSATERLAAQQVAETVVDGDELAVEMINSGIRIIILADTQGSLEAIEQNLGQEVQVLSARTGEVSESDVLHAHSTHSVIIAFNVKVNTSARKLAEIEKVVIKEYRVIYELLEDFEKQVLKFLEPTIDEVKTGTAKVKAIFNMKGEVIAGCIVTSGVLRLNDKIHVIRNESILADAKVGSLKQGKVDVSSVEENTQCGVILKPQVNIQENDILQAYTST